MLFHTIGIDLQIKQEFQLQVQRVSPGVKMLVLYAANPRSSLQKLPSHLSLQKRVSISTNPTAPSPTPANVKSTNSTEYICMIMV